MCIYEEMYVEFSISSNYLNVGVSIVMPDTGVKNTALTCADYGKAQFPITVV